MNPMLCQLSYAAVKFTFGNSLPGIGKKCKFFAVAEKKMEIVCREMSQLRIFLWLAIMGCPFRAGRAASESGVDRYGGQANWNLRRFRAYR